MKALAKIPTRRQERARLRRGLPWTWVDVLLLWPLIPALLALFVPALLADLGDTVIGSTRVPDGWNASYSSVLLAVARWGSIVGVIGILWAARDTPPWQRLFWGVLITGVIMNYCRNLYTGNPATVSFLVLQAGVIGLVWRLSLRPTIYARMLEAEREAKKCEQAAQDATERAERAEAELRRLKGET